jgi:epoxyqueuosine reductase
MGTDAPLLTERVREAARALGFYKVGISPARPLPHPDRLDRWLASGMHGETAYLERQAPRRADPRRILEDARSLVVVAMNYHSGRALLADPRRGRISRYAWGEDYHRLIQDRLRRLYELVRREEPSANGLYYVDTGPVMEKVWGAESALGWMGKHSNLITREQGSWFFIGVLLLNLELEYDAPERDLCGSCVRCMTACPTGAIVAPYVVDARLCISYLTIELRGPIPRPLRPLIGNRIFGCDDCQEVCPWNRFAVPTPLPEFRPAAGNWMPRLEPLVEISAGEFERRFRSSPIRRAKRDGLVRNVVVALGNSRDPEAVPALTKALEDASALVRAHAAWALGRIGSARARELLRHALARETDPTVLEEIREAMGERAPRETPIPH